MSDQSFPQLAAQMVPTSVLQKTETARQNGLQIILVTGVFDILHQEHLIFLQKAKALGFLVVAIESDLRVRQIKGEGRPNTPAEQRQLNLEKTQVPDCVFVLPEAFGKPEQNFQLLRELQPDILAVSSHTAHLDKKQALMEKIGGKLEVVHQHNPAVSTSQILADQKLSENNTLA